MNDPIISVQLQLSVWEEILETLEDDEDSSGLTRGAIDAIEEFIVEQTIKEFK